MNIWEFMKWRFSKNFKMMWSLRPCNLDCKCSMNQYRKSAREKFCDLRYIRDALRAIIWRYPTPIARDAVWTWLLSMIEERKLFDDSYSQNGPCSLVAVAGPTMMIALKRNQLASKVIHIVYRLCGTRRKRVKKARIAITYSTLDIATFIA